MRPGTANVQAWRFSAGTEMRAITGTVIEEDVLTIEVEGIGRYSLMWTPTVRDEGALGYTSADGVLARRRAPERLALACGFLLTEGLIEALDDIADMAVCKDRPDLVRVRLARPAATLVTRRNVLLASACGLCSGRDEMQGRLAKDAVTTDRLRIDAGRFPGIVASLRERQKVFGATGGAHAAMVFDARGRAGAFAEDLGRHNALDKVIGQCLLTRARMAAGLGVFVSSRLSYEMVSKAARAGFELIAAISAPTQLAIDAADQAGLTLCAFVRAQGLEVFTHRRRIRGAGAVSVDP